MKRDLQKYINQIIKECKEKTNSQIQSKADATADPAELAEWVPTAPQWGGFWFILVILPSSCAQLGTNGRLSVFCMEHRGMSL